MAHIMTRSIDSTGSTTNGCLVTMTGTIKRGQKVYVLFIAVCKYRLVMISIDLPGMYIPLSDDKHRFV